MAEGIIKNQTEEESTNDENIWWKSWYSTAKSKSGEVLDFLKQDLNEISSTVKMEATSFINNTTSVISDGIQVIPTSELSLATSSVKESVSSFISQVSTALNPQPLDGDEEPYIVKNDRIVSISKFQSKLYLLSADPSTYLKEIDENLLTRYNAWQDSLKNYEYNQLSNETLTKLLLSNTRLKENYEKLVPEKVSHGDFWNRYLFRKALLEDEEAEVQRRKNIDNKVCESLEWEKESFGSHLSPSEEEQNQLLKEYGSERSVGIPSKSITEETNDLKSGIDVNSASEVSSVQSAYDRESSSDDWEKDFDIEDIPTTSY